MLQDQLLRFVVEIIFGGCVTCYGMCVVILIAIQGICINGILTAENCPTTRLLWEKRAVNFTCNKDQGFTYHCILDDGGRLIETCLARKTILPDKGGCPEATFVDGALIHSADNSECPRNNDNCPSVNIAYFSDQLYIYPICFLNVSDRANYTEETFEKSEATAETGEKRDKTNNSSMTHLILTVLLTITLAASLIANGVMCFFRCRGEKGNGFIRLKELFCTKRTEH